MSLKKNFIERYVLDAPDKPVAVNFYDLVHKQKRITMRQNLLNPSYVKQRIGADLRYPVKLLGLLVKFPGKLLIEIVAALISYNPSGKSSAYKSDVAYKIDNFVPDTFIRKPETVLNGPVGTDNQYVSRT